MEQNVFYAFLLTFIAGLAMGIGSLLVLFMKKKNTKLLSFALGFSSGVMLMVSLVDMLPHAKEVFEETFGEGWCALATLGFLAVGFVVALAIEWLVPHEHHHGDEHCHHHHFSEKDSKMYRGAIIALIAISVHNIPEGMATFMTAYTDLSMGVAIMFAIAMHNIPVGMSVSMPIYYASGSKAKAVGLSFLSGMVELLGAIIAYSFLKPFLNDFILAIVLCIVAGLMIYIVFDELLPQSRECGHEHLSLYGILAGLAVMGFAVFMHC